jgi:hypothetical protein
VARGLSIEKRQSSIGNSICFVQQFIPEHYPPSVRYLVVNDVATRALPQQISSSFSSIRSGPGMAARSLPRAILTRSACPRWQGVLIIRPYFHYSQFSI